MAKKAARGKKMGQGKAAKKKAVRRRTPLGIAAPVLLHSEVEKVIVVIRKALDSSAFDSPDRVRAFCTALEEKEIGSGQKGSFPIRWNG